MIENYCQYKNMKLILKLLFLLFISSCMLKEDSPIATTANDANIIKSGDIIIVNGGNDSIILLDSEGNFKEYLYSPSTSAVYSFPAIMWDKVTKKVLFTNDSTTAANDQIMSIDPFDLTVSTVYNNSTILTATGLNGLARLTDGSLLAIEAASTMEKFDSSWNRVGAPFMNGTLTATAVDVASLSNGGFVVAASGVANTIRTYNSAGTAIASATSAVPTPTMGSAQAATGVAVNSNGEILAAFSGANDGVRKFSSDLATVIWTFADSRLTTPGKLAVRSNGNVLVLDTAFNYIVEINFDGTFKRTLASSLLTSPLAIMVVP